MKGCLWAVGFLAALALLLILPLLSMQWAQWKAVHHGRGASLAGANLLLAPLMKADLEGADLRGASLIKARCDDTDLRNADLRNADLRIARLVRTDLRGADLRGADLRSSTMGIKRWPQPLLAGARYDASTRWPAGFEPARHGAVKLP
jgi:Pentapeptide repeats (8 copies)